MRLHPISLASLTWLCAAALVLGATGAGAQRLTLSAVNEAQFTTELSSERLSPVVLKAQVLLDRAGFSPGVIDAFGGENFQKALVAFQRQNGLAESNKLDETAWAKLTATSADPVLIEYEIAKDDVKGPFLRKLPSRMEDMADLERLSYTGPREQLAEKFHMDEDLLEVLNRKQSFETAGTRIVVANVRTQAPKMKVTRIEIAKGERALRAFDKDGTLVAFYPASIGSEEKPAPQGAFKVRAISENPTYRYNPEFAFNGVKTDKPFKIAPGPNNPVGAVWIDLTADTYGIHGTPEPSKVSKTFSHGCIRLTNWDVRALAKMVEKGTEVTFVE